MLLCDMTVKLTQSERQNLHQLVVMAREEDLGTGDVTGRLLPATLKAEAHFVAREPLVLCGGILLSDIVREYDDLSEMILWKEEGDALEAGEVLAEWYGPAWAVMAAERVALNFLQRLSGVATATRRYVEAIAGTGATIYDTRKTTPGWRELEKYAVRVGGGANHRRGLYDAVMVKDNHIAALIGAGLASPLAEIAPALEDLRKELNHGGFVEVEVDTLEQFDDALKLPVDVILLDNVSAADLREAVARRDKAGLAGKVALEASGGITLEAVRAVAETGVERIAVGAITHSAPAVDIGLDLEIKMAESGG
jgi:nicotinate-nucleotide pyrophosphorylase (carboxylating)